MQSVLSTHRRNAVSYHPSKELQLVQEEQPQLVEVPEHMFEPVQVPDWQVSVVHEFPSLQERPFALFRVEPVSVHLLLVTEDEQPPPLHE